MASSSVAECGARRRERCFWHIAQSDFRMGSQWGLPSFEMMTDKSSLVIFNAIKPPCRAVMPDASVISFNVFKQWCVQVKDLRGGISVSAHKDFSGISHSLILCKERRLTASVKHISAENRVKNETRPKTKLQVQWRSLSLKHSMVTGGLWARTSTSSLQQYSSASQ